MAITIIILVLSAAFFMSGKVRSDLVALCALVLLILFNILTPEEALSGFSNSVVIMMIGLFVVGGAIFQTGLAKMISSRILKFAGTSELKLFVLIILVTAARRFCQQYGNGGIDAAYCGQHGHECQYQCKPSADASCFCQQYGWYDDVNWYSA